MKKMPHLNSINKGNTVAKCHSVAFKNGFTLIEVMVVVVILAIISAIALPSYVAYTRKAAASQAEQEMQKIAEQLERHKSRNFSYKGFDPNYIYGSNAPMTEVTLKEYSITIRDMNTGKPLTSADADMRGRNWSIKAETTDSQNYNYLFTSTGIRCKSKASISTYQSCPGTETW